MKLGQPDGTHSSYIQLGQQNEIDCNRKYLDNLWRWAETFAGNWQTEI